MKRNKIFMVILAIFAVVLTVGFCFAFDASAMGFVSMAAFTPCVGSLAASITQDCNNPRVNGYEDVALIFNRADIDWAAVTTETDNTRIVKTLAMLDGKTPFVVYNPKVNPAPFNGTNTAFSQDNSKYNKQVQFYFEGIGGAASKDVVEPLANGQYVILLQRKDHRGDGSFQLMGYQAGLVAVTQVQNEETGYWDITMGTSEPSAETAFFNTDYATTKTAFDALLAKVA